MAEEKDKKVEMEAVEITDGFWDKLRQIISDALGKPQEAPEVEDTVGKRTDVMLSMGAGPWMLEKEADIDAIQQYLEHS